MEISNLKELILNGREIVVNLGGALSKFLPFEGEKIAGLLVLVISFWIASTLFNMFPNMKNQFITKLVATAALFYILWLW